MKYLHGLMAGLWILSPQWLADSARLRSLQPEAKYEVQSSPRARKKNAPRRARLEVAEHGQSRLFQRYVVALLGAFPGPLSPTKQDLGDLLVAGRGVLASGLDELLHERHNGLNRVAIFGWAGAGSGTGAGAGAGAGAVSERVAEARRVERRLPREVPCVHYNWLVDCIDSYALLDPWLYRHDLIAD